MPAGGDPAGRAPIADLAGEVFTQQPGHRLLEVHAHAPVLQIITLEERRQQGRQIVAVHLLESLRNPLVPRDAGKRTVLHLPVHLHEVRFIGVKAAHFVLRLVDLRQRRRMHDLQKTFHRVGIEQIGITPRVFELRRGALGLDIAVADDGEKGVQFPRSVHPRHRDFVIPDLQVRRLHRLPARRRDCVERGGHKTLGSGRKIERDGANPLAGLAHGGQSPHLVFRIFFDNLPAAHAARITEVVGQPDRSTLRMRRIDPRSDLFPRLGPLLVKLLVEKTHVSADAVFRVFLQRPVVQLILHETVSIGRIGEFLCERLRVGNRRRRGLRGRRDRRGRLHHRFFGRRGGFGGRTGTGVHHGQGQRGHDDAAGEKQTLHRSKLAGGQLNPP